MSGSIRRSWTPAAADAHRSGASRRLRLLATAAVCIAVLAGGAGAARAASPGFVQQGGRLATHGTGAGRAVAISADGSTALVGEPDHAAVFVRSGSEWVEQARLTPTEIRGRFSYDDFGASVALSANGDVALVGAPADLEEEGAAYLYRRTGSTWTQVGAKLIDSECVWCRTGLEGGEPESGEIRFGESVALSAGGETAVIGAPGQEETEGAAVVFHVGASSHSETAELVPNDEGGNRTSEFGTAVAISGDGATILGGGPEDISTGTARPGAAWAFTLAEGKWSQDGSKLTGGEESGEGGFGESVALSSDGQTALVGGGFDEGKHGAVWPLARSGESWAQQGGKLTASGESGEGRFGEALALSQDGDTALIGAPYDNGSAGSAWTFGRSGETWSQSQHLSAGGESGAGRFGESVALSGEGTLALIGSPQDSAGAGAARSFIASSIPALVTGAAGEVGKTTATLNGIVNPDGREVESCEFEYGTTAAYGSTAACSSSPGAGESPVAVAAVLTGLEPGTTYHFRIRATNAAGGNVGEDATLFTVPEAPAVVTDPADTVTETSARLNATVNPNGGTVTECRFEYGTTPGLGSSAPCTTSPGSGRSPVAVSALLNGLNGHTTYYFRAVAVNAGGEGVGATLTFATSAAPPEFGLCNEVPGGTGAFADHGCKKPGGKLKYDWSTDVAGIGLTTSAGRVELNTAIGRWFSCTAESSGGEFTGPLTIGSITIRLTGCTSFGAPCTSPGAATGEIVSQPAEALLGVITQGATAAKDKLGLDLFPVDRSGALFEATCENGAPSTVVIGGSVIVPIKANKPLGGQTLAFKGKKGAQKPTSFAGGAPDVLTGTWNGTKAGFGLAASITIATTQAVLPSTYN